MRNGSSHGNTCSFDSLRRLPPTSALADGLVAWSGMEILEMSISPATASKPRTWQALLPATHASASSLLPPPRNILDDAVGVAATGAGAGATAAAAAAAAAAAESTLGPCL